MHSRFLSRTALLALILLPPFGCPLCCQAQAGPIDPRPEKRSGARGTAEPGLEFDRPHREFADAYPFGEIRDVFAFRNKTSRPVLIEQAIAVGGSGLAEAVPSVVPPGGTGEVRVIQPLGGDHLGKTGFRYALVTDEPGVERYRFSLSGFVQSAFEPEKPELLFGRLERGQGGALEIQVASREVPRLEIRGFEGLPPWLELAVAGQAAGDPQGVRIAAKIAGRPPLGWQRGDLQLRTNVPNQALLAVRYAATFYGDVLPSSDGISFGALELGGSYRQTLELKSRRGAPLELRAAADPEGKVKVAIAPCPGRPEDAACRELILDLALTPLAAPGPFSGRIEIAAGGETELLPIPYSGIASPPGTPIRQLAVPAPLGDHP